jgi:hypothetical protein
MDREGACHRIGSRQCKEGSKYESGSLDHDGESNADAEHGDSHLALVDLLY